MSDNQDIDYYLDHYRKMLKRGIVGRFFNINRKMIERPFNKNSHFSKILEIAAYDDQNLKFVKCSYDTYYLSDVNKIVIKFSKYYNSSKVKEIRIDANDLGSIETGIYDRIIVGCFVSHINDLSTFLSELRRITKNYGYVSIYVPCEPGALLRFVRSIINVPRSLVFFRKNHYDHVYSEHKIHYLSIKHMIRKTYKNDLVMHRKFPFRYFSWNLNFWSIYTIQVNKTM
jgi:SAM-dependent methyltransferase